MAVILLGPGYWSQAAAPSEPAQLESLHSGRDIMYIIGSCMRHNSVHSLPDFISLVIVGAVSIIPRCTKMKNVAMMVCVVVRGHG